MHHFLGVLYCANCAILGYVSRLVTEQLLCALGLLGDSIHLGKLPLSKLEVNHFRGGFFCQPALLYNSGSRTVSVFYTLKSHGQCLQQMTILWESNHFKTQQIAITWLIVCWLYFHHITIKNLGLYIYIHTPLCSIIIYSLFKSC